MLYNPRKNRQSHITNSSRKTITCLGFSDDGRHLVTGECGHLPSVRVWDVAERAQVAEFAGHKFGINCVVSVPQRVVPSGAVQGWVLIWARGCVFPARWVQLAASSRNLGPISVELDI